MANNPGLRLASLLGFISVVVALYYVGHSNGLPFSPQFIGADTAIVHPVKGVPLPAGLVDGDRIALKALDKPARAALLIGGQLNGNLAAGATIHLPVQRDGKITQIPVTTVNLSHTSFERPLIAWAEVFFTVLTVLLGVITAWRGRDSAATYFTLWCLSILIGVAPTFLPMPPSVPAPVLHFSYFWVFGGVFISRYVIYAMAEVVAGTALPTTARMVLRMLLALTIGVGITVAFGGELLFVYQGSAAWLTPNLRWLLAAPYLIPIATLALAWPRASGAHRLRILWLLWSLVFIFMGVLVRDMALFGPLATLGTDFGFVGLGMLCMVYAIVRHRIVDMSVMVDRTLVYGGVTALVVGVVAAVNSLVLRFALPAGASLALQVIVPLALGIVLGKMKYYMDRIVERVFFRRRYLAQQALRSFARHCGYIENLQELLDAAVANLARYVRTPGVAMYELSRQGYQSLRATGVLEFPKELRMDDPAMVAVRAEMKPLEVSDPDSELEHEAWVFPITVLGRLRGVMVCANRHGERFSSEEVALIMQVVHEVGAAWRILRARDNEALVWALADGEIKPTTAQRRARQLAYGARPARATG